MSEGQATRGPPSLGSGNTPGPSSVDGSVRVEIWSDVVCPWCYIGKRRFEAALARFEHADEVQIRWRSFELDPSAPAHRPLSGPEHLAAKYGMTVADAQARMESMDQVAAAEGLAFDLTHTQGGNTFDAHRLIHLGYSKDAQTGAATKEALLKSYFTDLQPIGEADVLIKAGIEAGLDSSEVSELLASDRYATEVRQDEADAAGLGCTGVPFFVFDRAFAVSGAQDSETFLATLRRAWERSHPVMVTGPGNVCGDDGCPI
jgi:predicted DsbA family dithiol-disulfide isomerase